jgi:hypothetical protein
MAIDYTKLIEKLDPERDGPDVTTLRTAIVDEVNSDGTLDIILSGVVVPDVPRLSTVSAVEGDVVQVQVSRGSILAVGFVNTNVSVAGRGRRVRVASTSSSSAVTGLASVLATPVTTFFAGRAYEVRTHGGFDPSQAAVVVDARAFRAGGAQIGEWYRTYLHTDQVYNATFSQLYFKVGAADVSVGIALHIGTSAGNVSHFATSGQPRHLEVWDVGAAADYPEAPNL